MEELDAGDARLLHALATRLLANEGPVGQVVGQLWAELAPPLEEERPRQRAQAEAWQQTKERLEKANAAVAKVEGKKKKQEHWLQDLEKQMAAATNEYRVV